MFFKESERSFVNFRVPKSLLRYRKFLNRKTKERCIHEMKIIIDGFKRRSVHLQNNVGRYVSVAKPKYI